MNFIFSKASSKDTESILPAFRQTMRANSCFATRSVAATPKGVPSILSSGLAGATPLHVAQHRDSHFLLQRISKRVPDRILPRFQVPQEKHDPVMTLRRRVQPVRRFCRHHQSRIEPKITSLASYLCKKSRAMC